MFQGDQGIRKGNAGCTEPRIGVKYEELSILVKEGGEQVSTVESARPKSKRGEAAGAEVGRAVGYRSPRGKLLKFFKQSRDQWKAKCRAAKARVKGLQTQLRYVEKSKASWKSRVQALEQELARMQADQHALADEVATLKKNT